MYRYLPALIGLFCFLSLIPAQERLNGGGSSFVKGMMDKWTSEYKKAKGIEVNYQSVGSGAGVTKMISGEFEFGCSDAPLSPSQEAEIKAKGQISVHVPLAMGGVVPAYNLEGLTKPVQFNGEVLAGIFMCKITNWSDPKLKALNPGLNLPDQKIVVVRRSDGSGTTFIWSDFLRKTSENWKNEMGANTVLTWHKDTTGQKGNEGVAGYVKQNPGSIGYIELLYAVQNKIPFGLVQNAEGEFIKASLESVTLAATNAKIPDSLKFMITNQPGKGVYPVSGTVWAIIYKSPKGGKKIVDFLSWVTSAEGQKFTKELDYAPLPDSLREKCQKVLSTVDVSK